MYCQASFSPDSFERLIKYRIADLFRPLTTPVAYPENMQSWLDGMIVTHIDFNQVPNDRFIVVAELTASETVVAPDQGPGYNAGALSMDLAASFFFASVQDVAIAGLSQPPVQTVMVPVGPLHITARMSVGLDGVPLLQMELDTNRLSALNLPASVIAALSGAASLTVPFDIGSQLGAIFPPGNTKVLNAGITRDADGAIVFRFTFPGLVWQSAIAHSYDWKDFFEPTFKSNLGSDDWCMDLDGNTVAAGLTSQVDPAFKDEKPIHFDSSWVDWSYVDDAIPRVVIAKHGRVENACAGNDVRFDAFANIDLSVEPGNVMRGRLSFDIDNNDWDLAKCVALTIANPLSVFITAVDHGQLGVGLIELAASFVFPTKAVLATAAIGLLIAGVDKMVAKKAIDDKLAEDPKVTQLPDGYAFDKKLSMTNSLTKDWLVLKKCTGSGGRLLLSGEFNVPDVVLPRLNASDLEGMGKWTLVDRCEPGKGQHANGSVSLSLIPGYGADLARVQPVRIHTIPLKWGLNPANGRDLMYQVVNDPLGIYQDTTSEYQEIYLPGIPGVVEVTLKASTLRKKGFTTFAQAPYPLRIRFFTNGGVREYEFVSPPPLQDYTETIAQTAARINNCKHRGTDLLFQKYLELKWRVDPPRQEGVIAQQWEVHLRGLEPGRKVTVWNRDTGAPLMHGFADRTGRVDVSLILHDTERAGSLLMGLDDEPFLSANHAHRLSDAPRTEAPVAAVEVAMRQTILIEVDHLNFDTSIEALSLADADAQGQRSALVVRTTSGQQVAHSIPSPYIVGLATPLAYDMPSASNAAERDSGRSSQVTWHGKQRRFTLLSQRASRTEVLAEYTARSSFDLGATRGDLFAQASGDGRRITLYQKGSPIQFGSHQWEEGTRGQSRT